VTAATFDDDGDPDTPEVSRRGSMYRLRADNTRVIANIDSALSQYMLPMPASSKIAAMGNGTPVAYGVAPVVCFAQQPSGAGATGIPCGGVGATSTSIATFVSVARLPGENASSTLVQTVGQYPKIGEDLISKPPITTSGSAGVTGTLQIVTNPNAGGAGVPVSVWTRIDVDKHGTTNTCYADEFFRYTVGSATPTPYQGTIRCDDCRCDANDAPDHAELRQQRHQPVYRAVLRLRRPGHPRRRRKHRFAHRLQHRPATRARTTTCVPTSTRTRSASSRRTCSSTSSVSSRGRTGNNDCFAETKNAAVIYQNPDNAAAIASVGPDEAYLYKIADKVIPTDANRDLVRVSQLGTSALLASENTSGIIWCQQDCNISSGAQIGTPSAPVLLILDGPVTIQGVVFGFVFIRDTGNTLRPATGSSMTVRAPMTACCRSTPDRPSTARSSCRARSSRTARPR
jgi:hypothetical protein